jgi:hypothetical protein
MQPMSLGEIIAVRVLHRTVNGGAPDDVIVRLGKPQPAPEGRGYATPFEIDGLDSLIAQSAFGVDAVQSLQLAFLMIGADLDFHRQQPGVELYFELPGDDLGFPEITR